MALDVPRREKDLIALWNLGGNGASTDQERGTAFMRDLAEVRTDLLFNELMMTVIIVF